MVLCGPLTVSSGQTVDATTVAGDLHETTVAFSRDPHVAASDYKLWVPKDVGTIRYVIAINMRAAGERLFFRDDEWKALATRTHAAIMYCEFITRRVRDNGLGASMLEAPKQFAKQIGHPELEYAPLVLWGHSLGGRVSQDFPRYMPSQVIGFIIAMRQGGTKPEENAQTDESVVVPGLYVMGAKDKKNADIREHFELGRTRGAARAWVWLEGQGHWPKGMSSEKDNATEEAWRAWVGHDLVIPWIEGLVRLRLSESGQESAEPVKLRDIDLSQGWLGDLTTGAIAPYDKFEGDRAKASWLPDQRTAERWAAMTFPEGKH